MTADAIERIVEACVTYRPCAYCGALVPIRRRAARGPARPQPRHRHDLVLGILPGADFAEAEEAEMTRDFIVSRIAHWQRRLEEATYKPARDIALREKVVATCVDRINAWHRRLRAIERKEAA